MKTKVFNNSKQVISRVVGLMFLLFFVGQATWAQKFSESFFDDEAEEVIAADSVMEQPTIAKKHINVVAAVIVDEDGKLLCMQRTRSTLPYMTEHWEFPGGNLENGEDPRVKLQSEISQDMDWNVEVGEYLGSVDYEYPDFTVTVKAYACKPGKGDFKLLEHLDSRWLSNDELSSLDWTDADRQLLELPSLIALTTVTAVPMAPAAPMAVTAPTAPSSKRPHAHKG